MDTLAPPLPPPFAAGLTPGLLELVADALDRSDDVVVVVARRRDALAIVGANGAFWRMVGQHAAALLGQDLLTLAWPGTGDEARARLLAGAIAGGSLRTELQCRDAAGRKFWFGLHLMPCGRAGHFVVLGRDITARLQASAQQKQTEELLVQVFLSADAALSIVDLDGRFLMTNPRHDRLNRCQTGALIGTSAVERLAPAARPAAAVARARQVADGAPYTIETELLLCDGATRRARLTSVAVKGRDRNRFRIVTLAELPEAELAGPELPGAEPPDPKPGPPPRIQVAGKIRLLGLEDVKAALGVQWPSLAERALATATHVLERRLGPEDSFVRTDDQGFLLCFGVAGEEEAALRTAAIGREIRVRLIGQGEDPAACAVTAVVAAVPLPAPGPPPPALLEARLADRRASIESDARRALGEALRAAVCETEPLFGHAGSHPPVAFQAVLPPALERRIERAAMALPPADLEGVDVNALLLRLADERALEDAAGRPMLVNAGFELFDHRATADRYVEACARLDAATRSRLMLMLARLPQGIAPGRLQDCMARLRPHCRGIGFELEELELPPVDLGAHGGINGGGVLIAIEARRWSGGGALPESRLVKLLARLHAHRGRLLVRHALTADVAGHLRRLGVDLVSLEPH